MDEDFESDRPWSRGLDGLDRPVVPTGLDRPGAGSPTAHVDDSAVLHML